MSNLRPAALSDEDLERLMRSDVRRTTLLAAWSLSLLYACADLAIRLGETLQLGAALWITTAFRSALWLQILSFVLALPLIWTLCYLADPGIEAAGRRSWLYRLGKLAHSRAFLLIYLLALIAAAVVALRYGVTLSSFWLILGILLLSCAVGLVEPGDELGSGLRDSWYRLALLLVRLPLIGPYISLGGVNRQVEAGLEQADAETPDPAPEGAAEQPNPPADPAPEGGRRAPVPGGEDPNGQ